MHRGWPARFKVESLERRVLLDAMPVGTEFRVNTVTAGPQFAASIAMDASGDFVVAWQSSDGSGYGIYAQRYNAAGVPQGAEFPVNTYTTLRQAAPAVAMDADGNFIVAWQSQLQDGSNYGVYAQRYNSTGAAAGAEFLVNTYTTSAQFAPAVAMDVDGDFIVAWHSYTQDGSSHGVYAQRYNATGDPQGGEFLVNTFSRDGRQRRFRHRLAQPRSGRRHRRRLRATIRRERATARRRVPRQHIYDKQSGLPVGGDGCRR
jgi:hypothetical protein